MTESLFVEDREPGRVNSSGRVVSQTPSPSKVSSAKRNKRNKQATNEAGDGEQTSTASRAPAAKQATPSKKGKKQTGASAAPTPTTPPRSRPSESTRETDVPAASSSGSDKKKKRRAPVVRYYSTKPTNSEDTPSRTGSGKKKRRQPKMRTAAPAGSNEVEGSDSVAPSNESAVPSDSSPAQRGAQPRARSERQKKKGQLTLRASSSKEAGLSGMETNGSSKTGADEGHKSNGDMGMSSAHREESGRNGNVPLSAKAIDMEGKQSTLPQEGTENGNSDAFRDEDDGPSEEELVLQRPSPSAEQAPEEDDGQDSDSSAPEEVPTRKRQKKKKQQSETLKRAWVDTADLEEEIDLLAVPRLKKLRKSEDEMRITAAVFQDKMRTMLADQASVKGATAAWAKIPTDGPIRVTTQKKKSSEEDSDLSEPEKLDEDDDDTNLSADVRALLRSTGQKRLSRSETGALKPGIIEAKPVPHANAADPSRCEARCVEFHPSGRLLMTAGFDKTMRVFSIDGENNTRVQSVHLQNFPVHSARFIRGGDAVLLSSRRRHLHSVDLQTGTVTAVRSLVGHEERSWEKATVDVGGNRAAIAGQHGKVVMMCTRSLQEVGQLRVNGRVAAMSFGVQQKEHEILTTTEDGMVHLWDARKMVCLDRHNDEGAVHSTGVASSFKHYATGSDSGVVNVYDSKTLNRGGNDTTGMAAPRIGVPVKRFMNLRTPIDHVAFNADGQVLAFASHAKKGAVRLAHTGSMTVFRNWPSANARVRRVCSLAFSPGGGYLAIGTDNGIVQMVRMMAYPAW